jgi:hypothetical protein
MAELNLPTEVVELPSKGLVYPEDHPFRKGTIEMKYMTAKEEDILTNQNYINKGTVLDKLLESLTMGKVNLKDLITGDKNALLIASRILGYGKDYSFVYNGTEYTVDLSTIESKELDSKLLTSRGTVQYTLPVSKNEVEFKFLTEADNTLIDQEINSLKKFNKDTSTEVTTRLKYQIVSVNGNTDKETIRQFVDNHLLASDSRSLRLYIKEISPDINLKTKVIINGVEEDIDIPVGLSFFWPDL